MVSCSACAPARWCARTPAPAASGCGSPKAASSAPSSTATGARPATTASVTRSTRPTWSPWAKGRRPDPRMVDIHCHLLPGIDDGATSFEDSAAMCEMLVADGCRAVIATPHQRHDLWPNHDLLALENLRRNVA